MSASAKGHSVHVIYDVTGKRYTVSVKASETHTSLSQITNGTLRKNMAAFVKLPLESLELYDKSSGDILYDTDYVPVGATVNLRVIAKNEQQSGKETTSSRGGTLPDEKGAAASRRLADDTVERTTAPVAAAPPLTSFSERPPRNPTNLVSAASTKNGFATTRSPSASSSRSRSPNMVQRRPNIRPSTRQPSAASVLHNDDGDSSDNDETQHAHYPQRRHHQQQQQRQHSNDNNMYREEEEEQEDRYEEDHYRKPHPSDSRGTSREEQRADERTSAKHQLAPSPSASSSMPRSNPMKHNTSNISDSAAEKLAAEVAMMMMMMNPHPHSSRPADSGSGGGAAPLHVRKNGSDALAAATTAKQQYSYRGGVEDESHVTYRGGEEEEGVARRGRDRVEDEDLYYHPKASNSTRRSASYRDDQEDYVRLRSRHHHQDPHGNGNHKSAKYDASAGEGDERRWSVRAPSGGNSRGGAPSPSPPPQQHNHKNNAPPRSQRDIDHGVDDPHCDDRFSSRESYTNNRRRRDDWGDDQEDRGESLAHDNNYYPGDDSHFAKTGTNASNYDRLRAVTGGMATRHNQHSQQSGLIYQRNKTMTAGPKAAQSRSSQERDGGDDMDLRKKVEELTAAKDALASELETLSSRITGIHMQRSGSTVANSDPPYSYPPYSYNAPPPPSSSAVATPRHHHATYNYNAPPTPPMSNHNHHLGHHPHIAGPPPPLIQPLHSSSLLPSAIGTPSRERFNAPVVGAIPPSVGGAVLSTSMTPYRSVVNPMTDRYDIYHQQQPPRGDGGLGTPNVSTSFPYNGNIAVAGAGHRDYQLQQRRTEEISRMRQQIDTLKSVMEEDAQKHTANAKSLQHTIRSKREARVAELQRLVADQKRLRNIAKEELSAAEENFSAAKRYADSSEAEAEDHRRQVDSSTAQLDTIKARIAHILLQEGHQKRSSSSATSSAEDLAQAIVAAAAQRSKAALLLEQCKRDNGGLRLGFDDLALRRKLLHNELEDAKGNIRVVVRLRPRLPSDDLTPHTLGSIEEGSLEISEARKCAYVTTPTAGSRCYEFYDMYGPAKDSLAQQGDLFEAQVLPLLNSVFDGYNVAVLAYGQTGSGKTFTIIGETADGTLSGLLPQSIEFMLSDAASKRTHYPTTITMTMVELYMDTVYDLLHVYDPANADIGERPDSARGGMDRNRRCELRQLPGSEGVTVVGAVEVILDSWAQAMQIIHTGINERQTHKTLKNAFSSRSHMILTVNAEVERTPGHLQRSKLVFSDLAGSERVSRSLSQGDRLKEAQHINKSLSALGDVLHALSATPRPQHIPYRNSKLTQLLQSTIGGNSKTLMVACISPHLPANHNLVETQSTLQFASRARLIRNTFTNKR